MGFYVTCCEVDSENGIGMPLAPDQFEFPRLHHMRNKQGIRQPTQHAALRNQEYQGKTFE